MSYIEVNRRKVYYEVHGQGQEILVLCNGIMMSCLSWKPFLPALAEKFKVILFDFFDQGQSDFYNKVYTQSLQVDVLKAVLKEIDEPKESITLLGISYGGEVAMQLVMEEPDLVGKLILANTTAYTHRQLKVIGDSWIEAAESYDGRKFFQLTIPPIYSPGFYEKNHQWLEGRQKNFQNLFQADWYDGFVRLVKSAENFDVRNHLSSISIPVLVLGAEDDLITPLSCQRDLAERINQATLMIFSNCGHASMYEKPRDFITAVTGFALFGHKNYSLS